MAALVANASAQAEESEVVEVSPVNDDPGLLLMVDSSIFGSADRRVNYISPVTLSEQSPSGERVYYRVHIRVDTSTMRPRSGEAITIQPGMTATTEILTGHNTILRYLLKPIIRTVDQSFGER